MNSDQKPAKSLDPAIYFLEKPPHCTTNICIMNCPATPQKKPRKSESMGSEAAVKSPYFIAPKRRNLLDSQLEDEDIFEIQSSTPSCTSSLFMSKLGRLKPLLIQEQIAESPWKLLVVVTLLNKTAGKLAIPTFWKILAKWPTPLELSKADEEELVSMIRHLGTQTIRAKRLITLSRAYIREPPSAYDLRPSKRASFFENSKGTSYPATPISHLPGTGPYALDSYRVFCTIHDDPTCEEWKLVMPTDKELIRYLRWRWAFFETMEWSPTKGPMYTLTVKYLTRLIVELEENKVST